MCVESVSRILGSFRPIVQEINAISRFLVKENSTDCSISARIIRKKER